MKYRIAWKSLLTDKYGIGEKEFDKQIADDIVEKLNKKWKDIIFHWPESKGLKDV